MPAITKDGKHCTVVVIVFACDAPNLVDCDGKLCLIQVPASIPGLSSQSLLHDDCEAER